MTKEALKLALEALEGYESCIDGYYADAVCPQIDKAITAIKEALAQPEQDGECKHCTDGCPACDARKLPEQEPVAWMNDSTPSGIFARHMEGAKNFGCTIPLYTTPPQRTWVGLTEKDILEAAVKSQEGISPRNDTLRFAVAIEAKLKEKNA